MIFQTLRHSTLLYRPEMNVSMVKPSCVSLQPLFFCRLTCPARKPKRENCTFYPTIGACVEAGYRPCKPCHPLQAAALADPTITALLHALGMRPGGRWSENHVIKLGYDPSTVRRSFRRQFGMTFLEIARQRRLREGFETLAVGGKVVMAQHEASLESASAFRAAFARLLGQSPSELQSDKLLRATWIPTPLGDMIAVLSRSHRHLLEFVDQEGPPAELSDRSSHRDSRGCTCQWCQSNSSHDSLSQGHR